MSNRTKLILIILILIVLVIIIRRTDLLTRIRRLFVKPYINYNCTPGMRVDPQRYPYLEGLASRLYSDLYDTPVLTGHDCSLYEEANALCDEELQYLAKHYRTALTRGPSLATDIAEDYSLLCQFDLFIAHLTKIGEI